MNYTHLADLAKEVNIPQDGIISRTLYSDEQVKAVIFGFSEGQELSEHTASVPAIIYIIRGEAEITLENDTIHAQPGCWIHMAPKLPHSVVASSDLLMLLLMLKSVPPAK